MMAMWARWAPPLERSRLMTLPGAGASFGSVVALPLTGYICEKLGWPAVFYLCGRWQKLPPPHSASFLFCFFKALLLPLQEAPDACGSCSGGLWCPTTPELTVESAQRREITSSALSERR